MSMSNENLTSRVLPLTSDLEFVRLQLEHAITTYQAIWSSLIQIITVLAIANATILGYAITTKIAGIMFLGAFFPIMIFAVELMANKRALPVIYTAISLEQKFGIANTDWLASTFISVTMSPDYLKHLKEIAKINDPVERIEQLKHAPIPLFKGIYSYLLPTGIVLVSLLQLIAPFFLWRLGWRMF